MKIKVFIVSYKNESILKNNIESLLTSDITNFNFFITVINNYVNYFPLKEYCLKNNITVLDNNLRPSFSTGHLSRSWNQCLIHGFKSITNPDADIVVLAQDDNIFLKNWCSYTIKNHINNDFITMGGGDQFHSYTVNHIKNVGLCDERFCNIGYQEYDYWIRSFLYNKDRSSINDPKHGRVYRPIENQIIDDSDFLIGGMRRDERHLNSIPYHSISRKILLAKWGDETDKLNKQIGWAPELERLEKLKTSKIPNFVYYPYFEKDIDFSGKNYII